MNKVILVILIFTGIISFSQNLITNGDFELGTTGGCDCATSFSCVNDAGRVVNGVHPIYNNSVTGCVIQTTNYNSTLGAHSGAGYIYFYAGSDRVISNPIIFPSTGSYTMCVWYSGPSGSGGTGQNTSNSYFTFTLDGVRVGPNNLVPTNTGWTQICHTLTITGGSHTVGIQSGGSAAYSIWLDDFEITLPCTSGSNTTPTTAICENGTKTLTATTSDGTWSIVSGGGSIAGTTYTPPNVSANTSVTVRYTDACGATSDRTFTVNVQEPAVNTTTTTSICEGSDKSLTGTPSGGTWNIVSGGGSITGSTYTAPTVTGATSVTVRYTIPANGACPASTDDVTFTVDDNVPPSNTTNTDTICEGGTKALTGTPGGGTFTLLNGSGSITGTTYTAGSISSPDLIEIEYASPAAGSCPAGEDTISFVVLPLPEPIITSVNDTMCEGTTRLLTGTPAGGAWSVVSGTATIINDTLMPTVAGTVVVQYLVTNTNGCSDSVTQTIESISAPLDPTVTASSDTICRGEQVTINGSGSGVGITYNVYSTLTGSSWLGVTPYTISPILTTTYYIDANNGTCMNNGGRQPITITVNPLPTVNTNGDQTICPTDQVILTATGGGTYLWSTGSTNDSITVSPLVDTTYYVTVTNSNNCSVTDSIQITLLNGTIVQAEDDSATVNTAVDTTIDVYINDNGDPNAITILSGPNNGTGTITSGILNYRSADDFVGVDTIVYELCDLVCPLLCDTAIVYLTVERDLFIPAFFSPNGDNINDEFIILGLEKYPDHEVKFFNRWGSLVYQSTSFTSWNGYSDGALLGGNSALPTGTYYYIIDLGIGNEPVAGFFQLKN